MINYPLHDKWISLSPSAYFDYSLGLVVGDYSWQGIHECLARIHRFGGRSPLTVLQHAWCVSQAVQDRGGNVLHAFTHDHHEAFIGDIPTPLQRCMGAEFNKINNLASAYIGSLTNAGFCLRTKEVDYEALVAEAHHFKVADWRNPDFKGIDFDKKYWKSLFERSEALTPTDATYYLEDLLNAESFHVHLRR